MTKKFLFLSAMVLMLASCGNADNALEEIINGGTTQEEIIKYGFKLTDLDGVDRTEAVTSLKMYKADGTPVATAEVSADHKVTITSSDLSAAGITSATDFWFDASIGGQAYVAKVNIDPKALSSETPKTLAMATLGDVILSDGTFAARENNPEALAMIAYLGDPGNADASGSYRGLALALKDAITGGNQDKHVWRDVTGSYCNENDYNSEEGAKADMWGIRNTDMLVTDGHDHKAATAARNYNGGTHPTGTSEWFLPSAGQWDLMITASGGYTALRSSFEDIDGEKLKSIYNINNTPSADCYWTSTEIDNNYAWAYSFYDNSWRNLFKNRSLYVRAAIAF